MTQLPTLTFEITHLSEFSVSESLTCNINISLLFK